MKFETILIEPGPVAQITINRPEKRNSITIQTMRELTAAFTMLDEDDSCRVIVLSGAGKGFCSGLDLSGVNDAAGFMKNRDAYREMPKVFTAMARAGKVVIGKVHGYAIAGGLGLAVACDLTVIADNAKLSTPEVMRGIYPFMIMAPIGRCMPQKKMLEMCFTADTLTAAEAARCGIANHAVPESELDAFVRSLAERIAAGSPSAIRLGKQAFYAQRDMEYFKSLDYLSEMLNASIQTADCAEGMKAFFEKRDPVWTGK